jgi:hypothetical protein
MKANTIHEVTMTKEELTQALIGYFLKKNLDIHADKLASSTPKEVDMFLSHSFDEFRIEIKEKQ